MNAAISALPHMPLWRLKASFHPTGSFDLAHTSTDSFRKLVKSSMCLGKMPQKCGVKMIIPQLAIPNVNKIHHVMQELRMI
jgi:hypothetical protein